jgi:hypothetical protein
VPICFQVHFGRQKFQAIQLFHGLIIEQMSDLSIDFVD